MTLKRWEHGQDIQDVEDTRRTIAKCSFCKNDIKVGNEEAYGDEAYYHDGLWACEDCKDKFLKQFQITTD